MTEEDEKPNESAQSRGLFITKGMVVSIPPGGFTLTAAADGSLSGAITALHVVLNMCPRWLAIACGHLFAADEAHQQLLSAHAANDETALGLALEAESNAGMQAVFASCAAMDAYYALLKEHTKIDPETTASWKKNRTARHVRIAEVVRRTVPVNDRKLEIVREILRQGFWMRDRAVHPTAELASPMQYDEIQRSTEWRFVYYRFSNAKAITGQFLNVIAATSSQPARIPTTGLTDLLRSTNDLCAHTLATWEERYGPLYPRSSGSAAAPDSQ